MKFWQAGYLAYAIAATVVWVSGTISILRSDLGKTPAAAFFLLWGVYGCVGAFIHSFALSAWGWRHGWGTLAMVSTLVHAVGLAVYLLLLLIGRLR